MYWVNFHLLNVSRGIHNVLKHHHAENPFGLRLHLHRPNARVKYLKGNSGKFLQLVYAESRQINLILKRSYQTFIENLFLCTIRSAKYISQNV